MNTNAKEAQVAIVMGSKSDLSTMVKVAEMLAMLEISSSLHIYSAHRTPVELSEFIKNEVNGEDSKCKVIIAGAGMSAALAGAIAAETWKPVIGIPLSGGKFHGVEALLSTIEMPPGNPVLTVGIDATKNAAIAAARIIALSDPEVMDAMINFKNNQREQVLVDNGFLATKDSYRN